jgi:hypothetical protein
VSEYILFLSIIYIVDRDFSIREARISDWAQIDLICFMMINEIIWTRLDSPITFWSRPKVRTEISVTLSNLQVALVNAQWTLANRRNSGWRKSYWRNSGNRTTNMDYAKSSDKDDHWESVLRIQDTYKKLPSSKISISPCWAEPLKSEYLFDL